MELHERLRQYNRWRRGEEDWPDYRGPDPKELGQLIDEAATALEELRRDQAEEEALRTRMANLLTQTAAALRGPPPKNVLWDWSDLPERAAAAIAAIDVMQRAAAMAAVPHGAPSVEAARAMGEKGGPIVEAERRILEAIDYRMNGGGCPTAVSLGECAAITQRGAEGSAGSYYTAHLYLHSGADGLTSSEVAGWFHALGAADVIVSAVLYDKDNNILNGSSIDDGVRPWDVSYFLPHNASANAQETKA